MSMDQDCEQEAQRILDRIAMMAKKARIGLKQSQGEAAFSAGLSVKAIQAVESAKNGHSMKLMVYLSYLGLTELLLNSLPDPERLTPIEKMAIAKGKTDSIRKARVSKNRHVVQSINPRMGVAEKKLPWKTE
mgnify:CR=1 FL=1